METISRFFNIPDQSFFLLGPRGTGKSTLITKLFPDAIYLDLLLPDLYRAYSARPEKLIELVQANEEKKVVIIDEVQKIPEILDVVHHLLEEKKGWKFILTGSSARKLKKTGIDLLAGRALVKHMHPFMAAEMGAVFNLEEALNFGLVPVILASKDRSSALKAYLDLYIKEEVQMEGLTRNIGAFSRFLEVVSFSHGSVLNISNVSRECQVERKVVEGYVNILEDLLLAFRIPVFSKRAKRALSTHPKFYFFDSGVYHVLRPRGPLDKNQEITGLGLEGLIAQHLRAWTDYKKPNSQLFFWRTLSGNEVDFVIYGPDIFWAIEVKNSTTVHPSDLKSLKTFGADYPEAKRILLYRGKEKLLKNGILVQPCEDFLLDLK